jgi:hypothetical protein
MMHFRLKLFEKEIEQQGAAPQPKPGFHFFLLLLLYIFVANAFISPF